MLVAARVSDKAPCYPARDPTPLTGTPDRRPGYTDHRTCDEVPRPPIGAVWSGSPVPFARPDTGRVLVRQCSPAISGHSSVLPADLLIPFAMHTSLTCPDYYGTSAPSPAHSRQRTCPPPTWLARGQGDRRRFPRSPRNRWAREMPSFVPAASPRLRRRLSPWPPDRHH